jgi:molecular chaperone DnaJ
VIKNPCNDCHGAGRRTMTKNLSVKVPAGIDDGQMLTLRGEGEPGAAGGPYGDLYVEVHLRPHPVFSREGYTTYCEVPVTFPQAALGAEIDVPTIDGPSKFTLKEGTQPGDLFTLRGKGIPHVDRANVRGDHKFRVILEVPRHLDARQKEILQQFGDATSNKNYQKVESFFGKIKDLFK